MRLLSVALPDDMDRLQGSGVRSSIQDHGRGAGGSPTGDRRHACKNSSRNDLALVGASKLIWFCVWAVEIDVIFVHGPNRVGLV